MIFVVIIFVAEFLDSDVSSLPTPFAVSCLICNTTGCRGSHAIYMVFNFTILSKQAYGNNVTFVSMLPVIDSIDNCTGLQSYNRNKHQQ